jgi:hypothetical protein
VAEVSQDRRALLDVGLWRVEQFQRLVSHADAKAGVVATAAGLLLAGLVGNAGALRATFGGTTGAHRLTQALFILTAAALVAVLGALGAVLLPRMRSGAANVFAPGGTPSRACLDVDMLAAYAWEQGAVLAHIAATKFAAVRWALMLVGAATAGFVSWAAVMAFL